MQTISALVTWWLPRRKDDHSAATTALAQDVALLADDAASYKSQVKQQFDRSAEHLTATQRAMEDVRNDVQKRVHERINLLVKEITVQQEQFRAAVTLLQKQQSKMKANLDSTMAAAAAATNGTDNAASSVQVQVRVADA